jgi:hypothetical protein
METNERQDDNKPQEPQNPEAAVDTIRVIRRPPPVRPAPKKVIIPAEPSNAPTKRVENGKEIITPQSFTPEPTATTREREDGKRIITPPPIESNSPTITERDGKRIIKPHIPTEEPAENTNITPAPGIQEVQHTNSPVLKKPPVKVIDSENTTPALGEEDTRTIKVKKVEKSIDNTPKRVASFDGQGNPIPRDTKAEDLEGAPQTPSNTPTEEAPVPESGFRVVTPTKPTARVIPRFNMNGERTN